ncbi:hypothetical protein ABT215_40740 [Streptomyces sp900105755]|uniref:hypothetical protein n=1 Tax=Streptomyces sp. 900105755 TaxID=3154389 RepID=UPI00331FB2F4
MGGATIETVAARMGAGGAADADGAAVQVGYASDIVGSRLGQAVGDALGEVGAKVPADAVAEAPMPVGAVAVSAGACLSVG